MAYSTILYGIGVTSVCTDALKFRNIVERLSKFKDDKIKRAKDYFLDLQTKL